MTIQGVILNNKFIIIAFLLSVSFISNAGVSLKSPQNLTASICVPSMDKFEACKQADRLVSEIEPTLPAQTDELTIIESVSSDGNMVTFYARLTGNKEQITSYFKKQNLKLEDVEAGMEEMTAGLMCKKKSTSSIFIKLGGHIRFVTKYKDGTHQQTITVKKCE